MYLPVTEATPELFGDTRNRWTKIGESGYYQSEEKDGICLEIRHIENGKWRWWLYDAKSPEPDLAVAVEDKDTLSEALSDVYGYLDGYSTTTN